ncbi:MAG: hypothetical protein U9R28_03155 [Pseudomonadota bacterium]|nr:hypothetical protein [Pseudomonadota bacterium]
MKLRKKYLVLAMAATFVAPVINAADEVVATDEVQAMTQLQFSQRLIMVRIFGLQLRLRRIMLQTLLVKPQV